MYPNGMDIEWQKAERRLVIDPQKSARFNYATRWGNLAGNAALAAMHAPKPRTFGMKGKA